MARSDLYIDPNPRAGHSFTHRDILFRYVATHRANNVAFYCDTAAYKGIALCSFLACVFFRKALVTPLWNIKGLGRGFLSPLREGSGVSWFGVCPQKRKEPKEKTMQRVYD